MIYLYDCKTVKKADTIANNILDIYVKLLKEEYQRDFFQVYKEYQLDELRTNITNFENALNEFQSLTTGENKIQVEDLNKLPEDIEKLSGRVSKM